MYVAMRASLYRHPPPHNPFSALIDKSIDKGGEGGSLMMDVYFLITSFSWHSNICPKLFPCI